MTKVGRPRDWKAAVKAAKFRYLGYTQAETAEQIGVSRGTVTNWEMSDWWGEAFEEAESHGLSDMALQARKVIMEKLEEGDIKTAQWILERRDKMFVKPKGRETTAEKTATGPDLSGMSEEDLRALAANE